MAHLDDSAQESRYRHRVDYMPRRVAATFYVCISLAVIALFALQGHAINQTCKDSAKNRSAIRETVIDGLPALGARFDTSTDRVIPHGRPIEYYTTHWEERQAALARAIRTLNRFPRIECGNYFDIL